MIEQLFLRRTVIVGEAVPDDFGVQHLGRTIGRIRLATERSPAIWTYSITVPLPVPPYASGSSPDLEVTKAAFREAWERFYATLDRKSIEIWHNTQDGAKDRFGRPTEDQ